MGQQTAEISLDAKDDKGVARKVRLKARHIKIQKSIKKKDQSVNNTTGQSIDIAASRAEVDQSFSSVRGVRQIITPPYNLHNLALLKNQSTELPQNVEAMTTNVVGFGYTLKERPMPEVIREKLKAEIELERFMIEAKLQAVHPVLSLTKLRKRSLHDKHLVGNGYLELIENKKGELVAMNHVAGHSVYLAGKESKPIMIDVPRIRPDKNFEIEMVPMWYRFRRFVQKLQNSRVIWFKEAGDPRPMDKDTGAYGTEEKPVPEGHLATHLIHDRVYHPLTPYGVPLWIGNTLSVLGSRASDEINFNTMQSNAIPSAMVIVEGGQLTEGSIERMQEFVEEQIQRSNNYSSFLLLEAEASEEGGLTPGNFKIRVEPMKQLQQADELFQVYDRNNRDKIRQSFRLPPIFVGRADDYSRATADTSRDVADEQVFDPERQEVDHFMDRFVLLRWGTRFHTFRSKTPNITDDIELIRMMLAGEKSGAMTPRRADRILTDIFGMGLGPMPKGIDLDKPFMLTFAEAQGGKGMGGRSPGIGPAKAENLISDLIKIRKGITEELDLRFDLDEDFA